MTRQIEAFAKVAFVVLSLFALVAFFWVLGVVAVAIRVGH